MLRRSVLYVGLLAAATVMARENTPPQFQAWGTRGPTLAPLPEGWKEIRAEPRVSPPPKPVPEETACGFILFQCRPFAPIDHEEVPAGFQRAVDLQAFAAQGQYEPFSFGLYATEALENVRIHVGPLKNAEGDTIPASWLDVRWVLPVRSPVDYGSRQDRRFSLVPFYLEKREQFEVAKEKAAQVWLTVKVPEDARAGDYRGQLEIQAGQKPTRQIPLIIKVLPFTLPPVPVEMAVSYFPAADPALRRKEMIDQREHGINANESSVAAQVVSRDRHFGEDDVAATRASIRTMLRLRKDVYSETANHFPVTVEIGQQILYEWDNAKGWNRTWPRSPELEADFFKAISICRETIRRELGLPMRLFIMDEPGGHPDTLAEAIEYYRLVKTKLPEIETCVTVGGGLGLGIDELGLLGPYADLLSLNRFNSDICRRLLERHKPYGIYNGGGATEALTGYTRDRYFFGFYGWKTGASQILQWVYQFGNPWGDPIRGNHGYVMPAADGPLPSIPWESLRAGIDDYRYMDLLWRLITVARQSAGTADAGRAAERAALDVVAQVGFDYQPRIGQGSAAPPCATLDAWRWQIASACTALLKVIPLQQALKTTVLRPGPLDLRQPEEIQSHFTYGPELLPDPGFESGLGPWKLSGPPVSSGGIDQTVAHSGRASFRLENSGTATATDVAVCVWGWGGVGPGMTLSAGNTYEFSAFVKTGSAMPQMRLALPKGTTALKDEEGEDATASSGWRRIWRRMTPSQDIKPAYLAVWLQGPGKIWADDLSLRELIQPAFDGR